MARILTRTESKTASRVNPENTEWPGNCQDPHCIPQMGDSLPRLYTRNEKGVCRGVYCEHEYQG